MGEIRAYLKPECIIANVESISAFANEGAFEIGEFFGREARHDSKGWWVDVGDMGQITKVPSDLRGSVLTLSHSWLLSAELQPGVYEYEDGAVIHLVPVKDLDLVKATVTVPGERVAHLLEAYNRF